jgi:single-strand DNA-binding protein
MNLCFLTGNLGNDPEVRYFTDGTPAVNFNLATTKRWKDKNGDKKDQTTWHRCVKIGKGADTLSTYLKKGSKILVVGEISNRSWESDGQKHQITEIKIKELEFLSSSRTTNRQPGEEEPLPDPMQDQPMLDDDVPF